MSALRTRCILVATVALLVAAGCLPEVPIVGRACQSDADCVGDDANDNGVQDHYCELGSPSVCLVGEPIATADNRAPRINSGLVLARVGETTSGRFAASDPDGDEVAFVAATLEGDVGTLTIEPDGSYAFAARADLVSDASDAYEVAVRDVPAVADDAIEVRTNVLVFVLSSARDGDLSEWTGAQSVSFGVAENWEPSDRVPDATVSIFVPPEVESRALVVTGARSVASLFTSPSSRVVLGELRVHGSQVLAAGLIESAAADNATVELVNRPDIAGDLPSVRVLNGANLVSPVQVFGDLLFPADAAPTPVDLDGYALSISGELRQDPGAGGLRLDNDGAVLEVTGDLVLSDGDNSFFRGLVLVGGDLRVGGGGLRAQPALQVLVSGTGSHEISFTDADEAWVHDLGTEVRAGLRFATDATVLGDLDVSFQLAVAPGREVRVGGTLRLQAGFVPGDDAGGVVRAGACQLAPNLDAIPEWIICDAGGIDPPPVDGGPLPDMDAGPPPMIEAALSVTPTAVFFGEPVTFTWSATGANACFLDGVELEDEDPDPAALGGTIIEVRPAPRAYTLRCEATGAATSVTAEVDSVECGGPVVEIGAVQTDAGVIGTFYDPLTVSELEDIAAEGGGGCFAIDGSLSVSGSELVDLAPLYGLTRVTGVVLLLDNDEMLAADGLELLEQIDNGLSVGSTQPAGSGNAVLVDVSALGNLRTVGGLLEDCEPGPFISCTPGLTIGHNDQLRRVDVLRGVQTVGDVTVVGNDGLRSLRGLSGVASWPGDLIVEDNAALTHLDGLQPTTTVAGRLRIASNPGLTHLDELDGLQTLGGALEVEDNASLLRLMAAPSLTTVGGDLRVVDNPALTELGLTGLTAVEGEVLQVEGNCLMSSAAQAFVERVGRAADGAGVTVQNNGACAP